jgi:ubiquinone/menaquinone biosynthesis C-methylase UbiE
MTSKAQNTSLFSKATKSGWYPQFLKPVVEAIVSNSKNNKVLDIGTGTGTLPQMLIKKDSSLEIIGIDINMAMIDEAKKRFSHKKVLFQYQEPNTALDFVDNQFDVITFCSVLFLVDDSAKTSLVNEALRVLKPEGKIIILTPSGKKTILSSFIEVWQFKYSLNNFTFPIWKIATTGKGRKWQVQKWLKNYANEKQLNYTFNLTFNNNATIEIISKNKQLK